MFRWSERWRSAALPAAVCLFGVAVAAASGLWLQREIEAQAQAAFERKVERVADAVAQRFRQPVYGLRGMNAFYAASLRVDRAAFRAHVEARDLPREFPGVRGFGFIQRVQSHGLDAFVAAERADGAPQFAVRRLAERGHDDLYVIKFIEPLAPNLSSLGLDVGSEPLRRQGAEQAVATGQATLSAPITLVQDESRSPGFLLYLPVFRPGTDPATPAQRQAALAGLLYALIVPADLLGGVADAEAGLMDFVLLASNDGPPVFDSLADIARRAGGAAVAAQHGRFEASRIVSLPGRDHTLRVHSSPGFDALIPRSPPWLFFLGGALTSLLLAALLRQQATGRHRAELLAERMTADLSRLALVAQRTSNAVVITDAQRRITWVNDGFTRITGYSAAEVIGQSPGRLLQCPETDPQTLKRLRDALNAGLTFNGEILNRGKTGRDYWLELEIQPLHGDNGLLTGFMAIETEITERKAVSAALETARAELSRLAMVAQRTSNAVIITDRELRITWVNDGFTRLYGYTAAEALGRTPGDLLRSEKTPAEALATLRRSADEGIGCRVDLVNRTAEGRDVWIDADVQPTLDADGRAIGFVEIASDTTASRRVSEELAFERERLQSILDGTQAGTWEHDLQTGADHINVSYAAMLGYTVDECVARMKVSVLDLVHADDTGRVTQARDAHLQGLTPDYAVEFRMRHKDGHWVWIQARGKASGQDAHGRPLGSAGIHLDISARKQAERELTRGSQRLANIIEGTGVGTWEWNVETGETAFNERWAEIVGHTLAELGPTTIDTWSRFAHPEDMSRSAVLLERHFNGETAAYECEARMRHKDGHWVWVLDRGKLFSRSEDGRPRWMAGTHMDITQRKQAEEALRAGQALLDQTGRIGGVGGWRMDLTTQAIEWTDQTCRIHDLAPGHRPTLEEAIQYYTPEARPAVEGAVAEAMRSGTGWDVELSLVTASGRAIWVRAVGEAEFVDGKPTRLVGAFQDVTARRALEAELRRSNEVMRSVLENLPCGLSVFDADLNLLASNRQMREVLDLPDTMFEQPSLRFEDVIRFNAARGEYGTQDVEATVQAIVERARGPVLPHQFERMRPDGTALEVRGAPMPGGGFVATYTDITASKRAEAEAAKSATLMRGAITAIDEAFVLYDPDDRLVFCNDKYREIYPEVAHLMVPGASFEQLIRPGAEAGRIKDAIGRVDEWMAERLATHRSGNATLVQKTADGRTLRVIERKMADGHIVGFRIDITELVQATEAAQQASLSKSQFLANMSHEIRTPMNAILGMLALLRKTELTPRQADYAAKTDGAARSLLGLLNDILDFSKVEAGKMTLDPHPFRIDQLLRDLSVILSASVGSKRVEVLFDVDPALPRHLVGDAMRLQQVLINLGGNAIKFTGEGEVVVSLAALEIGASEVTLEIAVRDTGIGIAPENQARIFSGFTQAEASTTRRFGGTGLGVAISQRLVGLMGGELKLDSAAGKGSRFHFRITLPLAADTLDDTPAAAVAAMPAALRALVVDDNPTARDVLERMGRSLGWAVDVAASGEEALALLQASAATGIAYQAVFVDWQMPGLDGWGTTQRIRELGLTGDAPVVVMVTAHGREMLEQRGVSEQALLDGFLVKPITASMLFDAVADARAGHDRPHLSAPAVVGGGARLTGLRLLLVEDNLNNQQVARELLEDEGASVQIANHGQEAVEAVAAAEPPFDVVLMDLQMPVMDGFTATRKIRQDLGQLTLPIIAMTANAMASDREACLAAGMNDHVGKPFDLNHLIGVLRRHAGRVGAAHAAVAPAPALAVHIAGAATRAGVELGAALARLGGKKEVYARMLRSFVGDLALMPEQLDGFMAVGQPEGAARLLHTLKGLAATLGAIDLTAAASTAEKRMAAAPPPAEAASAIAAAVAAIHGAGPGLAGLLQALQPPATSAPAAAGAGQPAPDLAALLAGLRQLADLLRDSDMGAMDAWAALQQRFAGDLGARMQALDDAVARLEFEPALQHCNELIEACTE